MDAAQAVGRTPFGGYLRNLRASSRLTLQTAAKAAGIGRVTLNRWETGAATPRLPELEAVLKALGATSAERRQAMSLLEAPRGLAVVRQEMERISEQLDLGPVPHGGRLLRAMRMRRGLSINDVGAAVGVTAWSVRRWEEGEVWPSVEQLHALCFALDAPEQELIALTVGAFSRPQLVGPRPSVDALMASLEAIKQDRFRLMKARLLDLAMLTLEAEAWHIAVQSASGRRVLAEVCATYAHYLGDQEQYPRMLAYANRAVNLMDEKGASDTLWVRSGVRAAVAASHKGTKLIAKRALPRFLALLSLAERPEQRSWIMVWTGEALIEDGSMDEGLQLIRQAIELIGRIDEWRARVWTADLANMLIKVGRPAAAMDLVPPNEKDDADPFFRASKILYLAEACWGVGLSSQAQDHLAEANRLIENHRVAHLRQRANVLASRL